MGRCELDVEPGKFRHLTTKEVALLSGTVRGKEISGDGMNDYGKLVPKHIQKLASYKPGKTLAAGGTGDRGALHQNGFEREPVRAFTVGD